VRVISLDNAQQTCLTLFLGLTLTLFSAFRKLLYGKHIIQLSVLLTAKPHETSPLRCFYCVPKKCIWAIMPHEQCLMNTRDTALLISLSADCGDFVI